MRSSLNSGSQVYFVHIYIYRKAYVSRCIYIYIYIIYIYIYIYISVYGGVSVVEWLMLWPVTSWSVLLKTFNSAQTTRLEIKLSINYFPTNPIYIYIYIYARWMLNEKSLHLWLKWRVKFRITGRVTSTKKKKKQKHEEGRRVQQLKHYDYRNEDEYSSS